MITAAQIIPLGLMIPVLVCVGYNDLRSMRIPNILSLVAVGLFLVSVPFVPFSEVLFRLLAATIVFAIGFAFFAFGLFGGGDVKILAALTLFVPSQSLTLFALVFSGSMLLGIVAITVWQWTPLLRSDGWAASQSKGQFAMGISIALSGVLHFLIMLLGFL